MKCFYVVNYNVEHNINIQYQLIMTTMITKTKTKATNKSNIKMYNMFSNIFSISENVIVSNSKFIRLNNLLRKKGYVVEEVSFCETSKMGGLFRCVTLPLIR